MLLFLFRAASDLLALAHLGFVCFAGAGGFLALRWRRVIFLHIPAAVWGALVEFLGLPCPLTAFENQLRRAGGEAGYAGGFIEHYISVIIYPVGLDREAQIILGFLLVAANLAAYGLLIARHPE